MRTSMRGSALRSCVSTFGVVGFLTAILFGLLSAIPGQAATPKPVTLDKPADSQTVRIDSVLNTLVEADWIDRDRRFQTARPRGPASVATTPVTVTTAQDAAGGCDGVKNGLWGFHVASGEQDPWWQVDLGREYQLDRVVIYNRLGSASRTRHLEILTAVDPSEEDANTNENENTNGKKTEPPKTEPPPQFTQVYQHDGSTFYGVEREPLTVRFSDRPVMARIVRVRVPGRCSLALDEIEVYASDEPRTNIALGKPADQISVSPHSKPGTMSNEDFAQYGFVPLGSTADGSATNGPKTSSRASFSLAHTRAVLDRADRLADRLRPRAEPERLEPLIQKLQRQDKQLSQLESAREQPPEPLRRTIYLDACRLARQIAFCNPLLDFDKILFIKRHDSVGVFHMCDQYYGCNAKPGGGLFVLSDPFGPAPKLTNLLQDTLVENGRLAGQKLAGGTFLSPELSYDGQTVLFAYSQAKAYETFKGKEAYAWGPEISYHIFKCQADGTGLVQLSDGPWNDFDPCLLPNGRIAFVSERRGGYLRCGRHCPVYTIFSMEPDGSDVVCLSFHETHEWHPSVTNDGMLVYTRWDYVDRDTNIAHHIWLSQPDGCDPRSYHGNYPDRRESRPWMEMNIRAIPGSHKFVATTGAHHGHEFGTLVLIDHRVQDDGAESQLERITPEVPFAEAEGGKAGVKASMVYGTPWPLGEDDYLCVYDPDAKNRGLYWIDRHGNKELLYRDSEISCLSPIPLRPRPTPPVLPTQTMQTIRDMRASSQGTSPSGQNTNPPSAVKNSTATVSVMNVYDSDTPWPEGTEIRSLRVIQVLPKSTAPPNQPRIGVANQTNARAVLGTVPVEQDGSVHFEAPVGMPIYFQALDARGLAVQSMRSATYLHPGEKLSCQGCHEDKHRSPEPTVRIPLALRRGPSRIEPDVDGSNPFNYVRLVQPVLDRHCVECHREEQALDLAGTLDGKNGWSRSYENLAAEYGFYFHVQNGSINTGVHGGSRTIPGAFGARAAKLLEYTDSRHHGVALDAEDFHRLTLWLDCNSEFYGSYENTEAQARGEVVRPTLY